MFEKKSIFQILDDKDNEKNEPLHLAVENGYEEIVQYLIAKGWNKRIS